MRRYKFSTIVVHSGEKEDLYGSVVFPIFQTSTFAFKSAENGAARFSGKGGYVYTRLGNPTVKALERCLALLEKGEDARACSSGMGAISTTVMSIARKGDHIVTTDCLYGGTSKLFLDILPRFGIEFSFVDSSDPERVRAAIKRNTKMIYIETPTNPTMKLTDLRTVSEIARDQGILLAVDNTFMSPCFQNPIELGADIVIHSLTKYLGGHSDLVGGIVVGSNSFLRDLDPILKNTGATLGPFDAWLTLRGIKTLSVRMIRHNENAMRVAEFLEKHRKIKKVMFPGLKSHPQHKLAKAQTRGFGGVLAFEVKGGVIAGRKLLNNVKLCTRAVSLGAVETLIEHPASMTHALLPKEERLKAGITEGLIRLSVGIEDAEDIISDLTQALAKT